MAEALDGVGDHLLGILPGDQGGTADPQVMVAVMVERRHHRAAPHQGLDQQLRTGVALVEPGHVFAQRGAVDVVQAPDVQRRVRPRAQGDGFDDLAQPGLTADQEDVTGPELVAKALEVDERALAARFFPGQPGHHPGPDPTPNGAGHLS
ncbi:MAG: hypothetical protein ACREXJ_05695 [Gammaproteobacteria bacterium]